MKQVAIYTRVSTDKQSVQSQLDELRETAKRMGYEIVHEFSDKGISGTKGRVDRPALDSMMKLATQRKFDMVMVWSIDRLGRSLQHLIEILNELNSMKIDLFFQQQAIDTTTATGKMMFSIMGALGAYERELIRSRVVAGLESAKARGVKLGRPSSLNDGLREAVKILKDKGLGVRETCRKLGIGCGTYYSIVNE